MMPPYSFQLLVAMSLRGSIASARAAASATLSAKAASSVIRMLCEEASCSAWLRRSAAIQSGIVAAIGDHQDFRRAGDGVDADLAEDFALGGGDIGIAGADNLVHRGDGLGAIGQGGDGLGPADAVDFGDAGAAAAASTSGLILPPLAGVTITMRFTPATWAGMAFISTEDG